MTASWTVPASGAQFPFGLGCVLCFFFFSHFLFLLLSGLSRSCAILDFFFYIFFSLFDSGKARNVYQVYRRWLLGRARRTSARARVRSEYPRHSMVTGHKACHVPAGVLPPGVRSSGPNQPASPETISNGDRALSSRAAVPTKPLRERRDCRPIRFNERQLKKREYNGTKFAKRVHTFFE